MLQYFSVSMSIFVAKTAILIVSALLPRGFHQVIMI